MSKIHHFRLLMWKNYILRKRHYFMTAFELLLPIMLCVILAYTNDKTRREEVTKFEAIVYRPHEEADILGYVIRGRTVYSNDRQRKKLLLYSPSNKFTDLLMKRFGDILRFREGEIIGKSTEKEIVTIFTNHSNVPAGLREEFLGGVVFKGSFPEDGSPPKALSYTIRLSPPWKTRRLYDTHADEGPRDAYSAPEAAKTNSASWATAVMNRVRTGRNIFCAPIIRGKLYIREIYKITKSYQELPSAQYIHFKFSGIQLAVDKSFLMMVCKNCRFEKLPKINMQLMPFPPYQIHKGIELILTVLLPLFLVMSFIFLCPVIIKGIVNEKEAGIKELMKMMGLSEIMTWIGWMINATMVMSVTIIIMLLFLSVGFSDVGGVIQHTDPTIFWFFTMLYAMACVAFCFAISAFFHKPTLATTIGIILWLATYFGPRIPMLRHYDTLTYAEKMVGCIFPNMALVFGIKVISFYEITGFNLRWYNVYRPAVSTDNFSLLDVFLMLAFDVVFYIAITWYVSSIMPGKYGVAKSWDFLFKPSYWFPKTELKGESTPVSTELSSKTSTKFEPEPRGLPVGIAIQGVHKTFMTLNGRIKRAVDGVTLNIYEGQITALLGHNGAGKTTLISILTGLFSPTSGTAKICGYDIQRNMDKVQQYLSLCPQHDMLFGYLTVEEHLILFGMLKGLSMSQSEAAGKDLIDKLNLSTKSQKISSSLSGGQKRKLSLAIALIGNSKVVILDEPTSGMDPEARRGVWDLLLSLRGNLTIIITTHFMEEADVLGDRIAIMAHGKVQCCGSSLFLKKHYGTGYTLKMTVEPNCDVERVTDVVQSNIEGSQLKAVLGTEVSYMLPTDRTANFPSLFEILSTEKDNLRISSFGVSLTTMEEVFLKVGEIADKEKQEIQDDEEFEPIFLSPEERKISIVTVGYKEKVEGYHLLIQQSLALLRKRMLYAARRHILFLFQAVIPISLAILCLHMSKPRQIKAVHDDPERELSLDPYLNRMTLFRSDQGEAQKYAEQYSRLLGKDHAQISEEADLEKVLMNFGKRDLAEYKEKCVVAADFKNTSDPSLTITAMYSSIALHSAGVSMNLINTAILHATAGTDYSITTSNFPLPDLDGFKHNLRLEKDSTTNMSLMFAVFLFSALALLATSFVICPLQENVCKAKQLQLMTGVPPRLYWMMSLLWDWTLYIITISIMMIVFLIFDKLDTYTSGTGLGVLFLLLLAFGFCSVPCSYLLSFVSKTPAGGFALLTLLHIVIGVIGTIMVWSMELSRIRKLIIVGEIMEWIFQLFPAFPACFGLLQFSFLATMNNRCAYTSKEAWNLICESPLAFLNETLPCCEAYCHFYDACVKRINYLSWNVNPEELRTTNSNFGVGQAILLLTVNGIIYIELILLIEKGVLKKIWNKVFFVHVPPDQGELDNDVQRERQSVSSVVRTSLSMNTFVVDKLCKNFGRFPAVKGISFGIQHRECFGLLGVNGAGKTTTFRMLSGDELPTSGTAYLCGVNMKKKRREYLSKIGYCPQFDGIVDVLSGEEMLKLFAALRGIPPDRSQEEVRKWTRRLGLEDHISRACGTYSGGNKRKLSTAMALIGDPPVVFLDEPTSGVDPVARRRLWQVLARFQFTGQSIVLTSHSMEECEALCSRVAIMVNGQFKCLGGPQHLKTKFGQGFTVMMKLKQRSDTTDLIKETSALKYRVEEKLDPCVLKDEHQGMLHYHVTNPAMSWTYLFQTMEAMKSQIDLLEDYSISETTLEQVFLSFAMEQREENIRHGLLHAVKNKLAKKEEEV